MSSLTSSQMEQMRNFRQRSLIPPEQLAKHSVTVVGCGSTGRQVVIGLANLGVLDMVIVDPETIGPENLGTQGWAYQDVGKYKVDVAAETVRELSRSTDVAAIKQLWSPDLPSTTVYFLCTDSISSRQEVWTAIKQRQGTLLVDGRMSALTMFVFNASTDDAESVSNFEKTLFEQSRQEALPCTARGTYFCANMCASLMVAVFALRVMGRSPKSPLFLSIPQLCDGSLWVNPKRSFTISAEDDPATCGGLSHS